MTSEIRLAFEHPEARAAATGSGHLDRISLRDHIVEVEIGAFQAERGTTQRICFNIVVEVRPQADPLDDDVDRILSYDAITQAIQIELAAERLNLLETLAARIAERVLAEPQAERVFVRIEKLDRGPGALGVEIVRTKEKFAGASHLRAFATDDTPHPNLTFLSNAALASDDLTGWLDQLESTGEPIVLCVGPAELDRPHAGAKAAQRRIDLLAIEQNAWVLAGLDPRCVVVGTRTELDWAARNGQMSVWAPSKMVLDAIDGPGADPIDAMALVTWFAGVVEAKELILVGASAPLDVDVPLRSVPLGQKSII